jgi:hypothetical protein
MDWLSAVLAEASEIPSRRTRWRWVAGGLAAVVARRTASSVAAIAGGAVLVGLAWHPGSANPAVPVERAGFVGTAILLAVLPGILRPLLGPVADPSPLVPHGTPYEVQMSVGDAAIKYYAALIFGPLAGLVIGAATASRRLA